MAHKKGLGSSKNGRDSNSKRLNNVGLGRDYTIFSLIEGHVKFTTKKGKKTLHVLPLENA